MMRCVGILGLAMGCSGAEVHLTLRVDDALVASGRAESIALINYEILGDQTDPLTQQLMHRFADGEERVVYHPAMSDVAMTFVIDGQDERGATIAHGEERAYVVAGAATDVTVTLHEVSSTVVSLDMASTQDLAQQEDLAAEDLAQEDISSGDMAVILPPRQLSPLSTVFLTTRLPTLRWSLPTGTDGALVELCRSDFLTCALVTVDQAAKTATPTSALAAGAWFWRLTGKQGSTAGSVSSPIWELIVPKFSSGFDSDWGPLLDVNGDGILDIAISATGDVNNPGKVEVRLGPSYGSPITINAPMGSPGNFGFKIAAAGDLNGDGFGDLVVAAPGFNTSSTTSAVYAFLGSPVGISTTPASGSISRMGGFELGPQLIPIGDVDGDGRADIVVGSQNTTNAVEVFLGSDSGLTATAAQVISSVPSFTMTAADFNRDGHLDLVVGDAVQSRVRIFHYASGALSGSANTTLTGGGFFGFAVSAGDYNSDGFVDLLVTDPITSSSKGSVYLYLGTSTGISSTSSAAQTLTGSPGDGIGINLASGDITGDGSWDFAVMSNGGVRSFHGSTTAAPNVFSAGTSISFSTGGSLAATDLYSGGGAGNFDLIVGDVNTKTVNVYLGGNSGLSSTSALSYTGSTAGYGSSVR